MTEVLHLIETIGRLARNLISTGCSLYKDIIWPVHGQSGERAHAFEHAILYWHVIEGLWEWID